MLGEWLRYIRESTASTNSAAQFAAEPAPTFLARMRDMPVLIEDGLWPAQVKAVKNLEASLAANKPRALIQMATGSGKTFTSISFIYRLIKFAGARRVLFLVDRGNLGRQTKKEFDQYLSPYNNFKFGEEYIVPAPDQQQPRQERARRHLHHPAHVLDAQGPRTARGGRRAFRRGRRIAVRRRAADRVQPRPSRSRASTSSSPTRPTAPSTSCGARCSTTSTPT
jgi:hypothetical protein